MKKEIFVSALLILFVFISFLFINPLVYSIRSEYRSSDLKQIITREENYERIDYIDSQNIITIAADAGYATMIRTKTSEGILEKYYDDKGILVPRQAGYFTALKKYDDLGRNNRIVFLDQVGNPCITRNGYAIEEREYNEKDKVIAIRYYDVNNKPICTALYGFEMINEYDDKGRNYKTTYMDLLGKAMMTSQGYASIIRQYYDKSPGHGKFENEFYYDDQGNPVALSLGQYGLHKEYNELGQSVVLTYLNSKGKPTPTSKGYTTVIRTFGADYNVITEQYFDLEGKPFALSQGQYGTKWENGHTVFLDINGNKTFNLRNFLYNNSWIVIPFAIIAIIVSSTACKKFNMFLLLPCFFSIIYLTLMFREDIGNKEFDFLHSYRYFFVDSESRSDIIKNVWLFIPFGAILYKIYPRKIILLFPAILSITIECIQFITHTGFCQLDDVFSNCIGAWMGFTVVRLTTELFQRIKSWRQNYTVQRR